MAPTVLSDLPGNNLGRSRANNLHELLAELHGLSGT